MRIAVGTDLVCIDRVKDLATSGSLAKILDASEILRSSHEHIAGRIALKEAAIKALGLSADDWLSVRIRGTPKPRLELLQKDETIASIDCSISHDGDYATAIVVVLYRDPEPATPSG